MITTLIFLAAAQQYDHGNPTPEEQMVLEMINRARANPTAEEARLKLAYGLPGSWTITENGSNPPFTVIARPPLAFNATLQGIARTHSKDMYDRAFFAHTNPDGKDPFDRMAAAGYSFSRAGENIAVGTPLTFYTADVLEDNLMIDSGVSGRGHRVNLLDIGSSSPFREIGIGHWAQSPSNAQGWQAFLTQDFGRGAGPFLVGVVYWDLDNDGFYDPGEGLGGVTITHTASGTSAITSSSGGFAIPVPTSGSTTVTATGLNLPGGSMVTGAPVALGAENVRVEFRVTIAAAPDSSVPKNGLPDFWETNYPGSAVATSDQDGDGFTSLQEFRGGSDPTVNASHPVPQPPTPAAPPSAPPPASGGGGGGGGGGCGALGIGVLIPVLLGAWRRTRS